MTISGRISSAPSAPAGDVPVEEQELPFPLAIVEEMVKALVKAMRAHQLYLQNNPMHQRALETAKSAFRPVWQHANDVKIEVTETELRWLGRTVLNEADKASDSLPWLLYKDGVRELELLSGFEDDELVQLLDIIQRVRRASPDEDDLITILWEQDFNRLRYRYVEISADNLQGIERTPFEERKIDVAEAAGASETASGIVSMSDFDSTLYFLDASEIAYLQNEVAGEYRHDLRTNVAAMLLDIFEAQTDIRVRDELVELLDYYLLHLLATHSFSATSYLLRECAEAVSRARSLTQAHRERLVHLPDRLSEPEALSQLLHALDDTIELPPRADLAELFGQLRGSALPVLLGWIARSQNPSLRPLLESAAERLASANTGELVKLINGDDRAVRLEAMKRAGALKTPAAVAPLTNAMSDADHEIRLVAVMALSNIASPGALQALERSIDDVARDVRIATVRALGAQVFRPALPRVESAIKGRQLRDADLTEKMAFFEAYGSLAGDPGIPFLDSVLNGKGLFGKKEDAEFRACAAMALGRIGTQRALISLQKASGEKDVIVRSAVNKAFRGGSPVA